MGGGTGTSSLATGLCACGGLVAGRGGRPSAAGGRRLRTKTQAMVHASGARMSPFVGHNMGPQQQPQAGADGAYAVSRGQFGFGCGLAFGKRGAAGDFLLLLTRVSPVEKAGFSDGGGDNIGGGNGGTGGGAGGSGGGGGGGRSDGPDEGPGAGDAGRIVPHVGASVWAWYNGLLETHPLVSKSLTAGLMNAVADLICQVFIEKVDHIDWRRLASFISIGLFCSGPGLHFWYGMLPKVVTVPGVGGVLIRIALDQLVFTPLGMISFFVVLLTLENRRDSIREKLEKDWWPTVVANWKVWIPFQIVNFGFVPPQLQVAATGLLGMVWSVFISYKGHT